MKKYIGTKQIEAEPCTLGSYYKETGKSPYSKDIEEHEETEEGYKVKYEDDYISWSPKDVFEKTYKVADTPVDKLNIELTKEVNALAYYTNYCDKNFEAAVLPLMIYLSKHHTPMTKVIVENNKAELVTGIESVVNDTFTVD